MEWEYMTRQGDTWDVLALDIYGTETLAWWIMIANTSHIRTLFFPAGVRLRIRETPTQASAQPLPPWDRNRQS